MTKLTRFWFKFDKSPNETEDVISDYHLWGVGVTAYNLDDAISLLKELVFREHEMPSDYETIENIDVSKLDERHVLPNIYKAPSNRGVWFPHGF